MLQEAVHYTGDTDILAVCLAGYQTADTTDYQINLHPRFTRLIEFINHSRVLQCIHFQNDMCLFSGFRHIYFITNPPAQLRQQIEPCHQQTFEFRFSHLLTQHTEKRMQVIDNYFIRSKQTRIGIYRCRFLIKIPRTDISIAAHLLSFLVAAKHQCHLRMHFQSRNTIYNVYSRFLHQFGRRQIIFFIKTCLQLHKDSHLLTVLCSSYQRIDNLRVFCHPILGNHNLFARRVVHRFVKEMDKMVKRMIGKVQQQITLIDISEDGFLFIQIIQFHGYRLDRCFITTIWIGQMRQVFKIEMLVTRNQLIAIDVKGIHKEFQIVHRHLAVIHKTTYRPYLALLHLLFQLLYHLFRTFGIIDKNIGITRYLATIAAIQLIAGKHTVNICLDDILHIHQIEILTHPGKLDETGHFAIWQFDDIIFLLTGVTTDDTHRKIKTVVTQKSLDAILTYRHGLQIRKNLLFEEVPDELRMHGLHLLLALVKHHMLLFTQSRNQLAFINANTVFHLLIHHLGYLMNKMFCLFLSNIITVTARSNRFMFCHTYLIELFEIGRIY